MLPSEDLLETVGGDGPRPGAGGEAALRFGVSGGAVGPPNRAPRRGRWCSGCAKAHPGSARRRGADEGPPKQKCEDCERSFATFGLATQGAQRWCGPCAKAHAGAVNAGLRRAVAHPLYTRFTNLFGASISEMTMVHVRPNPR